MGSAVAAAAFLAGSHGLVRCRDLRRAGVDGRWLRAQIQRGAWVEVFPGVVDTTGSPLTSATRIAAACLAAGLDGRAAGATAASLYGVAPLPSVDEDIYVAVPHGSHRVCVPGIVVHQDRHLDGANIIGGIPVVSPATMLAQMAGVLNDNDFRCLAAETVAKQLVTIDEMLAVSRASRRAGRIIRFGR